MCVDMYMYTMYMYMYTMYLYTMYMYTMYMYTMYMYTKVHVHTNNKHTIDNVVSHAVGTSSTVLQLQSVFNFKIAYPDLGCDHMHNLISTLTDTRNGISSTDIANYHFIFPSYWTSTSQS